MVKLIEMIKEVERIGDMFKLSDCEEAKKTYDRYIELVITNEVQIKEERNYLFDYWSDYKNG